MPQPPVVLVVGSLHHDIMVEADHLPRADETAVGSRWYAKFGGKGGNQAVAAQAAGAHGRMHVRGRGQGRFRHVPVGRPGHRRRGPSLRLGDRRRRLGDERGNPGPARATMRPPSYRAPSATGPGSSGRPEIWEGRPGPGAAERDSARDEPCRSDGGSGERCPRHPERGPRPERSRRICAPRWTS